MNSFLDEFTAAYVSVIIEVTFSIHLDCNSCEFLWKCRESQLGIDFVCVSHFERRHAYLLFEILNHVLGELWSSTFLWWVKSHELGVAALNRAIEISALDVELTWIKVR